MSTAGTPLTDEVISNNGTRYRLLAIEPLPPGTEGPTTLLGKGAFGTVSIALTEELTPLAVKKLSLDKTAEGYAETRAEIDKEVSIMQHLGRQADLIVKETDNPNQIELLVIQPFVAGIELEKYFGQLLARNAKLDTNDVIGKLHLLKEAITSWVATMEATQQLHNANVIHGDLHPGNVLYDPISKKATIIDFGMAHKLEPGQEKVYVAEESLVSNYHRAPETRLLEVRRADRPPERVYDKSTDLYSLAIDFGVTSDFSDAYAPDAASKETAQIFKLCKELSQAVELGGNNRPDQRISITEGIARLQAIQSQIDIRIWQQQFVFPHAEIKQLAEQKMAANSLQKQLMAHQLPANVKEEIKALSDLIKQRWRETAKIYQSQLSTSSSPLSRPSPVLPALGKRTSEARSPQPSPPSSPTMSPPTREKGKFKND